jgi:hypothetical protein
MTQVSRIAVSGCKYQDVDLIIKGRGHQTAKIMTPHYYCLLAESELLTMKQAMGLGEVELVRHCCRDFDEIKSIQEAGTCGGRSLQH